MELNLIEQLEKIFDKYYKLNNKYVDIFSGILDELENVDIVEVISIINKDKRFIRLNSTSFGLLKWLLDDVQLYLNLFEFIDFKTIRELAIEIYKYDDIENDVLERYFPNIRRRYNLIDINDIRERYFTNRTFEEDIVAEQNEKLEKENEDKGLADKLEAYFDDYYKKYKSTVKLSIFKENIFNIEDEELLRIVNQDKRFYKLSDRNFALVCWIFDVVESELKLRDKIKFDRIKYIVQRKFKTTMINIDNLRKIFPSDIEEFTSFNVSRIKEKYLGIKDTIVDKQYLNLEVQKNDIVTQESYKVKNEVDDNKSQADKIEAYFDNYYKKYKSSVRLSYFKENILNIDEDELLRIVNQDKRFYKLSDRNLALVRWIFDVVESELRIRDGIRFERIKFLVQRKFKTSKINIDDLRKIFPSSVGEFNLSSINKIKEKYFNIKNDKINMADKQTKEETDSIFLQDSSKINYAVDDKSLIDKIEAYFQTEYGKYHTSIVINSKVEQDMCLNSKDIIKALDSDKRFYKLNLNNYGLLKWMLDAIEKKMQTEPELGFSNIKKIARSVYGNYIINIDNLRIIFKPDVYSYDISYIQMIRKKYLEDIADVNVVSFNISNVSSNSIKDLEVDSRKDEDSERNIASKIEKISSDEKLIRIFDAYYGKYHKSVKLDSRILQEIGLGIEQVRGILKNDKRFFKISDSNFALLKWLLDKIEEKVMADGYVHFSQIKNIANYVFGSPKINTYGLRDIFKYKVHEYDIDYIKEIRKEYLNCERKTNISNEQIIHDSTLELNEEKREESNQSKIKDIRELKDFGLKYGYIYYEDIEDLDITSEYQSITELMIDFSELGIELLDK